jgi:putative transposase
MMLLVRLSHCLNATTRRRLAVIVEGLLSMTERVTMLGVSRWTESGGSDRTVQRFLNTTIAWGQVHWLIVRPPLRDPDEEVVIAGDEVVVTQSGKHTHGLDRFFSSIHRRS